MAQADFPRFMLAAEGSGQGKTLLTCALLAMFQSEGIFVQAFKCGPDYIDPMYHQAVLGRPSYNLDGFFSDENALRFLMGRHAKGAKEGRQVGVVEGVMGYYDGLGGLSERASSYETARCLGIPVVLIMDASKRSLSALAALKGFLEYRPESMVRGVIFNRLSPALFPGLKERVETELGIRAVGFLPKLSDIVLESRHLGLILPGEIPEFQKKINRMAKTLRPGIDLEGLFSIAKEAGPLSWALREVFRIQKEPVIAVARDEAFCFYYEDNLETLERMGARLLFFSPLQDQEFPGECDGLYLGGGYPELYARELSENISMRESIRLAVQSGLPCLAECGGYLYLKEALWDEQGQRFPMAGVLTGEGKNSGRLGRFGYGTMTANRNGLLGEAGTKFAAHEFHYWDCAENGDAFCFKKPLGGRSWDCGYMTESLYAGFPHLYFYGYEPCNFLRKAAEWRNRI